MAIEQCLYLILLTVLAGLVMVIYVRTRNRNTDKWMNEIATKRQTRSGIFIDGLTDKEWEKYNGR